MTPWDTETAAGTRTIYPVAQHCRVAPGAEKTALTEWIFPHPLKPEQPTRPSAASDKTESSHFQPVTRCTRKPGTGCISDLNDHLFGGPLLARLAGRNQTLQARLRPHPGGTEGAHSADERGAEGRTGPPAGDPPPCKLHKKERQIWEHMKFHPDETNMSVIAKGAKATRHTVAKHY